MTEGDGAGEGGALVPPRGLNKTPQGTEFPVVRATEIPVGTRLLLGLKDDSVVLGVSTKNPEAGRGREG